MGEEYLCPYCNGELSRPTRKQKCPHCNRTIVVRTRPNQKPAWVKVEDIPLVAKEWADEMLRRDVEQKRLTGIEGIELARHNIRQWVLSGVVKSLKLHTATDSAVCDACGKMSGRVFQIETPEQICLFYHARSWTILELSSGRRSTPTLPSR